MTRRRVTCSASRLGRRSRRLRAPCIPRARSAVGGRLGQCDDVARGGIRALRGQVLEDLAAEAFVQVDARRLNEMRLAARELRAAAGLVRSAPTRWSSCRRWSASVPFRERPYARLICAKAKPPNRECLLQDRGGTTVTSRGVAKAQVVRRVLQGGKMIYNWHRYDAVKAHRPSRAYPANSESCSDRTVSAAHQPSSDLTFWTDLSGIFAKPHRHSSARTKDDGS